MKRTKTVPDIPLPEPITEREREILALMAEHRMNKEIAASLHLALSTVKWYTRQIYGKLDAKNRRHAIERAANLGIIGSTQASPIPNNLPAPATPFVGRKVESEELVRLLAGGATRLITLYGPGGSGKTRLAIEVASGLIEAGTHHFRDGVWFVPLVALSSPDAIPQTIAKTLGHTFGDREMEPIQQLTDYLQKRRLLLALDNFEHLMTTEGVRVITEINTHAPHVKLLVTSRSLLNVYGEQLFPVTGMQTPTAEKPAEVDWKNFGALQLFLQCARRVRPTFEIHDQNLAPLIQICQLVEGMPLGIELAAAWLELLSPKEIAERIKQSLDFLETDQTGIPDRQRSMRAVFDSSWKLLTDEEQKAYLRLCVVIGSFSHEAAQKITATSLNTLLGLVNKSWLQQVGDGKFQSHELMRQFGEEILQSDSKAWHAAKDSHATYYADFVAEQSLTMRGPAQIDGLIAIDEEFDANIKIAWNWLVAKNQWAKIIEKMIPGLYHYAVIVKRFDNLIPLLRDVRLKIIDTEMSRLEQLAFAIFGTIETYCENEFYILDNDPWTRLINIWQLVTEQHLADDMGYWYVMLAGLTYTKNLATDAKERLDEAVARVRNNNDPWMLGVSLMIQANWWLVFNLDGNKLLEALKIFESLGVPYEQSCVAGMLEAFAAQDRQEPAEIKKYFEQSCEFYTTLGTLYPRFNYLIYASVSPDSYFHIGEFDKGFTAFHEEQRYFEQSGHTGWLAHSLNWESQAAVQYSTFEHARKTRERSLELAKKSGIQTFIFWWIYEYGEIYRVFGDQVKALELYEQAQTGFKQTKITLGLGYCQRAHGSIALQNAQYSDALRHYLEYREYARQDNHLWSMAQARGKLARAYAHLGALKTSRNELQNTLTPTYIWKKDGLILDSLLAEPVCLIQEGRYKQAVEFLSLILMNKFSWNETRRDAMVLMSEASEPLPPNVVERAKLHGENASLEDLIKKYIQTNGF
jgi:predicted ATPase/DNA-binding CsgD family transcriptional regulator/tetratricopeptide (TPR) repeat protein